MRKNEAPIDSPGAEAHRRAVLPAAAGGLCGVLGLIVMAGWHTHHLRLLTILPGFVAMAYNTALAFALVGAALLAAARGWTRAARAGAACGAAIGLLTLTEYVSGHELGIDELLMKEYITAGVLNPTRMAVSTALCFSLAGTALLLAAWPAPRSPHLHSGRDGVIGLLGALVAGLGVVALSGYFTGIVAAYAWGQLTRMAVHTAVGFVVLGSGIVALAWGMDLDDLRKPSASGESRPDYRPRWLPLTVGVGVATGTLCLWQALVVRETADLALVLRLKAMTAGVGTASLVRTQSLLPWLCLVGGLLLAALLAWVVSLAQTARRRTVQSEIANERLQAEIAERRQAEEALRESQEHLELALAAGSTATFTADLTTGELVGSTEYATLMGLPFGTQIASYPEFLNCVAPDDLAGVIAEDIRALRERTFFRQEFRVLTPDGSTRWLAAQGRFLYSETGQPRCISGAVSDVSALKTAEEELRHANDALEARVQERTADLAAVNEFLLHEVAERRQAEDRLERQREFLRSVIDMDPNLIFVKDYDGRFTLVNEAAARLYGTTVQNMVGKSDRDFNMDEAEVEHFLRDDRAVMDTLQSRIVPEEKITDAEGRVRWLSTVKQALVISGEAHGLLGIATDITERKRQEAELLRQQAQLSEQRAFLRQVIDAVPSVLFVKDMAGRYTLVNRAAAEWFGADADDIIGKTDGDLVPEDLAERLRRDDGDVLRTRQDKYIAEDLYAHPQGREQWFQSVKRALVSPDGAVSYVLGVGTDITERKSLEAALSEQQAFLRQVLDTAPNCIFVKDAGGRYILANAATARLFGRTVEEFVGQHDEALMPEAQAEQFRALDREVIESGQDKFVPERRVIGAGGREYWIESIKRPFVTGDGATYTLGIATDVTKRRQLESERSRLEAQIMQSEKLAALGELVAGVAHEINNPLAAILGNAELLGMHADPQVREDADAILRMSQRANRIVRSLLAFAHNRGGERREEDFNRLVGDTLEMAAYKLRQANVSLRAHLQDVSPRTSVDANEIQQIVLNLINNAEHALRGTAGPKTITIRTGTQEREGRAWATVSVTDTGCGIPEEVRSRIFDPFFTTKGIGEGTGLGLSICHGIAEAHGGHLTVESAVGVGTTVTLALPLGAPATLLERAAA